MKDVQDLNKFLDNKMFREWVLNPNPQLNYYWETWILHHPKESRNVELARNFISSVGYKNQYDFKESEYDLVLGNIIKEFGPEEKERNFYSSNKFRIAGVAASIILATIFISQFFFTQSPCEDCIVEKVKLTKETKYGMKLTLMLPDGTKVHLNSGSRLTYEKPFSLQTRSVNLIGEAFFEVTPNKEIPFVIKSGNIQTKVLGTSFNIKAYPEESEIAVSVITGNVEVNTTEGSKNVKLSPNEMATYNIDQQTMAISNFSEMSVIGWKDQILRFDNEELVNVIQVIKRWYGVEFIVPPDLQFEGKYSGTYQNASLESVLEGLSLTSKFTYHLNNDIVTIKKLDKQMDKKLN